MATNLYSSDLGTNTTTSPTVDPYASIKKRYAGQRDLIEKEQRRAESEAEKALKRRMASQGMQGSGIYQDLASQQRRDIQEATAQSLAGLGAQEEAAIAEKEKWDKQFGLQEQIRLDSLAQDQRDFASDMFMNKLNFYTTARQLGMGNTSAKQFAEDMFSQFNVSYDGGTGNFVIGADSGTSNSSGLPSLTSESSASNDNIKQMMSEDLIEYKRGRLSRGEFKSKYGILPHELKGGSWYYLSQWNKN